VGEITTEVAREVGAVKATVVGQEPGRVLRHNEVTASREDGIPREGEIDPGDELPSAEVYGNYYGTHRSAIDNAIRERKDLVLDIDVQGARQLKVAIPEAITIFVLPPSREVLEQRLRARSQDSEEVIQRRLKAAAEEVRNYIQYDYVLINREIEESAGRLVTIVRAERMRRARLQEEVERILEGFGSN